MKIINKKITELKPYEDNPRINDHAVEAVANSIKEFGFKVPCVIDKNGGLTAFQGFCRKVQKNRKNLSSALDKHSSFCLISKTRTRASHVTNKKTAT